MRIINEKMLPKELLKVIENDELEWDGGVSISSIDYFEDDAKIELSILLDRSDNVRQLWEVQLEGIRNQKINRDWAEDIIIYDQHFLIQEQRDFKSELYIKNKPLDTHKLLYDLYMYFSKNYNGFISFDKYLNGVYNIEFLFNINHGLFAKGPKFILIEIDEILKNNGCSTYFFGNNKPQRLFNNQWVEDTSDLFTLLIGRSFFVAETILFERV